MSASHILEILKKKNDKNKSNANAVKEAVGAEAPPANHPTTTTTSHPSPPAEEETRKDIPEFIHDPHSPLHYRRNTDLLSRRVTANTLVEALQRCLGEPRKREREAVVEEEEKEKGEEAVVSSLVRAVSDRMDTPTATTVPSSASLFDDVEYQRNVKSAGVYLRGALRGPCRNVDHYRREKRLASGVYGVVFSATRVGDDTRTLYALKQIKKQWLEESEVGFPPYVLREIDLLLRLKHPNIVSGKELVLLYPKISPIKRYRLEKEKLLSQMEEFVQQQEKIHAGIVKHGGSSVPFHCTSDMFINSGIFNQKPSSSMNRSGGDHEEDKFELQGNIRDVFLVMEYCPYDLRSFTRGVDASTKVAFLHLSRINHHPDAKRVLLSKIKSIVYQMFTGLAFLHEHRVLHRDLKTANVLVSGSGIVKLCDFGLGRFYREGQPLSPSVVTLMYRAPELLFGISDYSHVVDVWSLGVIMAELFLKAPLMVCHSDSEVELFTRMVEVLGGYPTEAQFPGLYQLPQALQRLRSLPHFSPCTGEEGRRAALRSVFESSSCLDCTLLPPSGLDLLLQLLQWCPADRPSAREVLAHPFFTEDPLPCRPIELMAPLPFLRGESPLKPPTATTALEGSAAAMESPSQSPTFDSPTHRGTLKEMSEEEEARAAREARLKANVDREPETEEEEKKQ